MDSNCEYFVLNGQIDAAIAKTAECNRLTKTSKFSVKWMNAYSGGSLQPGVEM